MIDRRLFRYAQSARSYIAFTTVTGILLTALVVTQVILIGGIVGPAVDGTAGWDELSGSVALLAAVLAGRILVLTLQERYAHRASQAVVTSLRRQVLDAAVAQGPRYLDASRSAELVTLTTRGLDDLGPYFERYLPQLLLAATLTPASLIALFATDLTSGIILAVAIPVIPMFMYLVGVLTASYSSKRLAVMDRLGGQLMDLLGGLATLKALGRERGPGARVRSLADAFTNATMPTLRVAFLSGAILEFVASISVALVAVVAGMRLVYGNMDLASGLIAIMLAPEILMPIRQVGSHFHASTDGMAAAEAAFEVLERPLPQSGTRPAPNLSRARIVIDDVSVTAPGRHLLAPAQLTAQIEPGSITALVGPSGAGKSTTALVLLGLLVPDEGRVTITDDSGAIDLADVDPVTWHEQITWVPQRPTILPGTIAQNVLGQYDDDATITTRLEEAARASGLASVLAAAPLGWHTKIGHGGVGLSVGQRQRLALARAFAAATPVVLLDEPTAHLDAATEADVTAAVQELKASGRTVIVIAHRPGVLAAADDVIAVTSRTLQQSEAAL